MKKQFLYQLAYNFRQALEVVVKKRQYGRLNLFSNFPRGCCAYTSDLLAEYLIDSGISMDRIQTVNGETIDEDYTHCWLMIDNSFFVDITADQFNREPYFKRYEPIPVCCIVNKGTYLYEIFDKRKITYSHEIGIDSYFGENQQRLREVYDAVIRQLKNES